MGHKIDGLDHRNMRWPNQLKPLPIFTWFFTIHAKSVKVIFLEVQGVFKKPLGMKKHGLALRIDCKILKLQFWRKKGVLKRDMLEIRSSRTFQGLLFNSIVAKAVIQLQFLLYGHQQHQANERRAVERRRRIRTAELRCLRSPRLDN